MEEENFRLQPDWIKEVQAKHVLHWNYRGFVEVPRELQHAGDQLEEIYMKWNYISQLVSPAPLSLYFLSRLLSFSPSKSPHSRAQPPYFDATCCFSKV